MDQVDTYPNLFIVGAAKSGTTSLHNYLDQHPDIFMSNPKEPHFLINNEIGKSRIPKGITLEEQYLKLFISGKEQKYRGESSVMYLMFPEIVIPKINQKFGEDCKIIIMLRNPIDRAYSGFQHVKRYNVKEDVLDFSSAWAICEDRYALDPEMTPASRYKELGLYYNQVKLYLEGIKNVHIIIYDDYKNDFQFEINKVFDFLELKKIAINSQKKYMVGGWQWKGNVIKKIMLQNNLITSFLKVLIPSKSLRKKIIKIIKSRYTLPSKDMSNEDRKIMKLFYKEDVRKLSLLIKKNLNYWIE